jgi:hypothetical protein
MTTKTLQSQCFAVFFMESHSRLAEDDSGGVG